ncbi:hypothetical protein [Roseivirga pacifica]|uniref:hypothetical protein n=1 Tax=Roseivirga pacifica TaxID=1267423 RepID=UPI003BAE9D18
MKGVLRIRTKTNNALKFNDDSEDHNAYFSRLIKLIPAEVLTLYAMGQANIPDEEVWAEVIFGLVCCILVVFSRAYATSDENNKPQWSAVLVSTISFMIWLYLESPIFIILELQIAWLGTIIMAIWMFLVPYFYKGEVIE